MERLRLFWGVLLLSFALNVVAHTNQVVTMNLENVSVEQFLKEFKKQTGMKFLYNADALRSVDNVSVNVVSMKWSEVLDRVLSSRGFSYKVENGLVVLRKVTDDSTKRFLTGIVTDASGDILVGATVTIKYAKRSPAYLTTDMNGKFKIAIKGGEKQISVSYVGFQPYTINIREGKDNYSIRLKEALQNVDEVVVTGIFTKAKESFTGAAVKVTQEELKMASNRTALQALANLDPSFVITDNNLTGSNPNNLPEIRLRGVSSIPTVDQLQNSTRAELCTPLFILDGFEISLTQMMDLTNDEIESITILKDASATAIYGSRGSNGVVVITSVKPQKGRLKVSYSTGLNLEIPSLGSYNLMNASEKLQMEYEAGLYSSDVVSDDWTLKQSYAKKLSRVMAGVDTDWIHIPVQTGIGSNHYLNIGGGDDSFRYNLGVSYRNVVGAMKGSVRNNLNGRVGISYMHKAFNFQNSMSFAINEAKDSPYGSFSDYVSMNPYWEPLDEEGRLIKQFETETNSLFTKPVGNPYYSAMQDDFSKNRYTNITNNMALTYKPMPNFQATVNFSFGKTFNETDLFVSPANVINYSGDEILKGQRTYRNGTATNWAANATVSYYKNWDDHILTVNLNTEMREERNRTQGLSVIGYANGSMNGLSNGQAYFGTSPSSSNTVKRTIGVTGNLNYNYASRYYVDASYRLDGSSSFGRDSRFAPFWSVGVGYTVSNEKFMRETMPFITSLRLRYSYGVTGSISFDPWQSQGTYYYGQSNNSSYRGGVAAYIRGLENKDLKWQTTDQHNAGFDLSLFNGIVSIMGNWYRRVTNNAITDMSLPISTGFESYTGNSGKILNTGTDLSVSLKLIRNMEKKMTWSVNMGTSHNTNKLLTLSEAVKARMNQLKNATSTNLYYVYEEGNSTDAIYAVPTAGVDPATGKMVYRYRDGSLSYNYDVNQRVVCGDRMPKLDMRIGTVFQYKGFSFNAGFTIRSGGQQYNYTYANKIENVDYLRNADRRVLTSRWKNPGDEASFVGYDSRSNYIIDRYVQNERTFSCNNINLSYTFEPSLVKRIGLSSLSLNGSIGNVFYISTIKQERGTSYPYAIQPSFGFACSF